MLTVLRGLPDFFAIIIILWHHVTGVPTGTGSITPSLQSWSRPAYTCCCQWIGIGIGLCFATGLAAGSIIRRRGGPDIIGSVWCSHVLNEEDA